MSFPHDATSVVSVVAGNMDNAGEVMVAAAHVNGYAVDIPWCARATQLSMRQTLRLPRRCTRDDLYEARCAITPYDAPFVSVRAHRDKKCAVAAVSLPDRVGEQVRLAQEQGVDNILVLLCTDATPLRRAAATRCNAFVAFWLGGPARARNPHNWVTWSVMDGNVDRGRLCAMDAEAGLNAQIEHLQ